MLDTDKTSSPAPESVQRMKHLLDELIHAKSARRRAAAEELVSIGMDAATAIHDIYKPDLYRQQKEARAGLHFTPWLLSALIVTMVPSL